MRNKTQRYYYPDRHYPPKHHRSICYSDPYSKGHIKREKELEKRCQKDNSAMIFTTALMAIACALELIFPGIILGLTQ